MADVKIEDSVRVDRRKLANLARSNRDLYGALSAIEALGDMAFDLGAVAGQAKAALAREPEFDQIPFFVQVDLSWADTLMPCVECGKNVPWADGLLVPCSSVEDGEVDRMGVLHRRGCPPRGDARAANASG